MSNMNNQETDTTKELTSYETTENWETTGLTQYWNTKVIQSSWRSNEESFSQALDNAWLDDEVIASSMYEIATWATKVVKDENDELKELPDYKTRTNMIKLALQAKWHLSKKEEKPDDMSDKIYVFVKQ